MSKNGEQKKKVFLCYAREDQPLMDDFYNRFKNYNKSDTEILYDRHAESRNMHEVFNDFAQQCDVALLLVNASFIDSSSYANMYEVPILKERKEVGEVVVVGVRFSNVTDLAEWNSDGEFSFFSLTNNDLPYTRSKNPEDNSFLKKFAVYKQVDDKDLDDYHDRLRKWIKDCLLKSNINGLYRANSILVKENYVFRDSSILEKILSVMKSNSLIYKLEKTLSTEKSSWDNAQIPVPSDGENWSFWYLFKQADKYEELQNSFCKITPEDPLRKLTLLFQKTEQRTVDFLKIIEGEKEDENRLDIELEKQLNKIISALDYASVKIIDGPRKNHTEVKSRIVDAIESLRVFIKSLAGSSLGGS
jgi:hypothetical protein